MYVLYKISTWLEFLLDFLNDSMVELICPLCATYSLYTVSPQPARRY